MMASRLIAWANAVALVAHDFKARCEALTFTALLEDLKGAFEAPRFKDLCFNPKAVVQPFKDAALSLKNMVRLDSYAGVAMTLTL